MTKSRLLWVIAFFSLGLSMTMGCSARPRGGEEEEEGGSPDLAVAQCKKGETRCSAAAFQSCENGTWRTRMTCFGGKLCHDKLACVDCAPGSTSCDGDDVRTCSDTGILGDVSETCGPGLCQAGKCQDTCAGRPTEPIYVVDEQYRLLSFNPKGGANTFKEIGKINCADAGLATPFSMSVDREGRAWVLFNNGSIFWVKTADASCMKSPFVPDQMGFELFGMGFVTDAKGSEKETLHIAGGLEIAIEDARLARIDAASLKVTPIGQLKTNEYGPELTGTGNGELWAYFPGTLKTFVAQVDKNTAQNIKEYPLPPLMGAARAWAFAHWGGRFYIFITTSNLGSTVSQVLLLDPRDGSSKVLVPNVPYTIVGAGVSTCAPVIVE